MKILKEGKLKSPENSLKFFKEHLKELGKVNYVVLYYAEKEWAINSGLYHQYVIIISDYTQLWLSGLTWGYYGAGPSGLLELFEIIDPSITYEQIVELEWLAENPIMFENLNNKLVVKPFNEVVHSHLCGEGNRLPWKIKNPHRSTFR